MFVVGRPSTLQHRVTRMKYVENVSKYKNLLNDNIWMFACEIDLLFVEKTTKAAHVNAALISHPNLRHVLLLECVQMLSSSEHLDLGAPTHR